MSAMNASAAGNLGLRVATCNLYGGRHAAELGARIGRLNPDVVALQEVDRGCARTGGADTLDVFAVAAGLTGEQRLLPTLRLPDPDGGLSGEFGVALLLAAGHTVAQWGAWPLVDAHRHPGLREPRIALTAALPGGPTVAVVHLPPRRTTIEQRAWEDAWQTLVGHLASQPAGPLLAVGDFNRPPRSLPALPDGLHVARSAAATFRPRDGDRKPDGDHELDYALTDAGRHTVQRVDMSGLSDHDAVLFDLTW